MEVAKLSAPPNLEVRLVSCNESAINRWPTSLFQEIHPVKNSCCPMLASYYVIGLGVSLYILHVCVCVCMCACMCVHQKIVV